MQDLIDGTVEVKQAHYDTIIAMFDSECNDPRAFIHTVVCVILGRDAMGLHIKLESSNSLIS